MGGAADASGASDDAEDQKQDTTGPQLSKAVQHISSSISVRTAGISALTGYAYSRDTETSREPRVSDPVLTKRCTAFMKNHLESHAIRRVMVGTDRSETADQAVHWAAGFANRYDAELFVVQVVVPQYPSATEFGEAEQTRAASRQRRPGALRAAGRRGARSCPGRSGCRSGSGDRPRR